MFFDVSKFEREPEKRLPLCGTCKLYKSCASPKMSVQGKGKRKILIVFSEVSQQQDLTGSFFEEDEIGSVFRSNGSQIEKDCWATAATICRGDKIRDTHRKYCLPNLKNLIASLKPTVVVPVGSAAIASVLKRIWEPADEAQRWLGECIPLASHGYWVCPLPDSGFLQQHQKKEANMARFFLEKYVRKILTIDAPPPVNSAIETSKSQIEIAMNLKQIKAWFADLQKAKTSAVAFDYETTMLKPDVESSQIFSCGLCYKTKGVYRTIAFPWLPGCSDLLTEVLRRKDLVKVAHNLKFEERWTLAKVGCRIAEPRWDTMLMAHLLDNREGTKSLKFQAFVKFGVLPYNKQIEGFLTAPKGYQSNRVNEAPLQSLLTYNAEDALYEILLYEWQKRKLERPEE